MDTLVGGPLAPFMYISVNSSLASLLMMPILQETSTFIFFGVHHYSFPLKLARCKEASLLKRTMENGSS